YPTRSRRPAAPCPRDGAKAGSGRVSRPPEPPQTGPVTALGPLLSHIAQPRGSDQQLRLEARGKVARDGFVALSERAQKPAEFGGRTRSGGSSTALSIRPSRRARCRGGGCSTIPSSSCSTSRWAATGPAIRIRQLCFRRPCGWITYGCTRGRERRV